MKRILLLLIIFLLCACSPKIINNIPENNTIMINLMNNKYSINLLDSMCVSDTLPNVNTWEKLYLREYETKAGLTIYIYYKNNTSYKVEKINEDSVKIIKRIIK